MVVLLGFADKQFLLDPQKENKAAIETAAEFHDVQQILFENEDHHRHSELALFEDQVRAGRGKQVFVHYMWSECYLAKYQKQAEQLMLARLPPYLRKPLLEEEEALRSRLDSQVSRLQEYEGTTHFPGSTDLEAQVQDTFRANAEQLVFDFRQFNAKVVVQSREAVEHDESYIRYAAIGQYCLFGFGWFLSFVLKIFVEKEGFGELPEG